MSGAVHGLSIPTARPARERGCDPMSQPQIPYVMLDGEEIRLNEVEFLNVEEDIISGRDLITFMYEGETHQSYVVHRPC